MLVSNLNRNTAVTIHSHDGDSVDILPGTQDVPVDDKFDWNLPREVVKTEFTLYSTTKPLEYKSTIEPPNNASSSFGEKHVDESNEDHNA